MKKDYFIEKIKEFKYMSGFKDEKINNLIISSMFNGIEFKEQNLEELEKYITDGRKDKSIDVFALVKEGTNDQTAYFIQHTTNQKHINQKIRSTFTEMQEFLGNDNWEESNANTEVKNMRNTIKNNDKVKKFRYVFIADVPLKAIESDTWDYVKKNSDYWLIDKSIFNALKIKWLIKKQKLDELNNIKPALFIPYDDIVLGEINSGKHPNISIGLMKVASIMKAYNKFGNEVFDKNVRYYLGDGKTPNKKIVGSIQDGNINEFPELNNGLTIAVTSIEKNDNLKIYNLWDAQIINGAQTTTTIANIADEDILNKLIVPFKIIKIQNTKNKKEISARMNKISIASNTQNAVNNRDLKANDELQLKLQKYFFERNILLEIKTNEFSNNLFYKGLNSVTNTLIGQLYMSTELEDPAKAKNAKMSVFNDKNYPNIFKITNLKVLFSVYKIYIKIEKIFNELKLNMYFNFVMLYFIYKQMMNTKDEWVDDVDSLLKEYTNDFIKTHYEGILTYLETNDLKDNGEIKDIRLLATSNRVKELIDQYILSINDTDEE